MQRIIIVEEPNPRAPGFFHRIYARVDVTSTVADWFWHIVSTAAPTAPARGPFKSEQEAWDHAKQTLGGVWET